MEINGISNAFKDVNSGYSTVGAPNNMLSQFSSKVSAALDFGNDGGTTLENDGVHI